MEDGNTAIASDAMKSRRFTVISPASRNKPNFRLGQFPELFV
jgi:hypothetical protein